MDVRQDIVNFVLHGKSVIFTALKETHYVNGMVYHVNGFDTTTALRTIVSPTTLVLAPMSLPLGKGPHAVGKVMTPRMFSVRKPVHNGPILWLYAYTRNGSVASLTLLPKSQREPL